MIFWPVLKGNCYLYYPIVEFFDVYLLLFLTFELDKEETIILNLELRGDFILWIL